MTDMRHFINLVESPQPKLRVALEYLVAAGYGLAVLVKGGEIVQPTTRRDAIVMRLLDGSDSFLIRVVKRDRRVLTIAVDPDDSVVLQPMPGHEALADDLRDRFGL